MNATPSVQDLWSQILALPAADRRWLQDKLEVYEEEEEAEHLAPYTMEEIHERIRRSEADIAAGRTYSSEEVHRQMREYTRREPRAQAAQTEQQRNTNP